MSSFSNSNNGNGGRTAYLHRRNNSSYQSFLPRVNSQPSTPAGLQQQQEQSSTTANHTRVPSGVTLTPLPLPLLPAHQVQLERQIDRISSARSSASRSGNVTPTPPPHVSTLSGLPRPLSRQNSALSDRPSSHSRKPSILPKLVETMATVDEAPASSSSAPLGDRVRKLSQSKRLLTKGDAEAQKQARNNFKAEYIRLKEEVYMLRLPNATSAQDAPALTEADARLRAIVGQLQSMDTIHTAFCTELDKAWEKKFLALEKTYGSYKLYDPDDSDDD